jgi:hypothetical protein
MGSFMIIEVEVVLQSPFECRNALILFQINVFIFHAAPQAFHKDIVERPPATIHTDADARLSQATGEGVGCELRTLIGVEDFGLGVTQSLIEGIATYKSNTDIH